jgi:hypothetical protein
MEDSRDPPQDPQTLPRRFVYRAAEPDSSIAHPLRRATDTPHPFRSLAGQPNPKAQLLRFRVYLKLN